MHATADLAACPAKCPLMLAAGSGNADFVELLLDARASVEANEGGPSLDAVLSAVCNTKGDGFNQARMISCLQSRGCTVNWPHLGQGGGTASRRSSSAAVTRHGQAVPSTPASTASLWAGYRPGVAQPMMTHGWAPGPCAASAILASAGAAPAQQGRRASRRHGPRRRRSQHRWSLHRRSQHRRSQRCRSLRRGPQHRRSQSRPRRRMRPQLRSRRLQLRRRRWLRLRPPPRSRSIGRPQAEEVGAAARRMPRPRAEEEVGAAAHRILLGGRRISSAAHRILRGPPAAGRGPTWTKRTGCGGGATVTKLGCIPRPAFRQDKAVGPGARAGGSRCGSTRRCSPSDFLFF